MGRSSSSCWQPLLAAAKLPYRKPHAMRHSYATWMLEAGADLRWVKDQLGHASIEETEGTYGHLERERHGRRVDLDAVLGIGSGASTGVHALDAGAAIEGQLLDFPSEDLVVEGKGFAVEGLTTARTYVGSMCRARQIIATRATIRHNFSSA